MARKIKTKSPGARQRSATLPARRADLDLCRIDTARIRALPTPALRKAINKVGPIYMLPEKESGAKSFRWLLSLFMANLRDLRETPTTPRDIRYMEERFRPESYPRLTDQEIEEKREHNLMLLRSAERDAADHEQRIWELQEKAGCNIRPAEAVARDAEKESFKPGTWWRAATPEAKARADEIRRGERRPRTPYKGRKPIIR